MKKQRMLITSIISIVIVLSVVQVAVSNSLSTTGIELSQIEKTLQVYKTENAVLSQKLLSETSLTEIASKAATLGFAQGKSQVIVGLSLPVAVKP